MTNIHYYLSLYPPSSGVFGSWRWNSSDKLYPSLAGEAGVYVNIPEDGKGFLVGAKDLFDDPIASCYDPARCGAFADWLEENEDRLLEGFSTEDRPLAQERLQALRQWLRSGFQPKE